MRLEGFSDLYFALAVLVPGFIYNGVVSTFVPIRPSKEREVILLRYLTATAFNYAICSPAIYVLVSGEVSRPLTQALSWFGIAFVAPVILAVCRAEIVQRDGIRWLYYRLGLRAINPIPTGWDWIFSTTDPCFVLVTLTDGTEIAGYFGSRSLASSDPENRDIYIERVYKVPEDGAQWAAVEGSLGMHISGAQIAYIEFRR